MTHGEEVGIPKPLIEPIDRALQDADDLMGSQNQPGARVTVGLAPCVIWGVDRPTLDETRKLADQRQAFITMHLAETPFEIANATERFGMPDVEFLDVIDFLGANVLAVHCVHCRRKDVRILKLRDVKVSHNPCSNMYLASGFAPIPDMLMAGVTVSLGCDGPASNNNQNMIHTLKFGALIHKGYHQDATVMTAEKVLEMATIDGARALGMEQDIGSIEPGKKADLVVLRFDNPFVTPVHAPVSSLVYSALGNEPETVIIDGEIVMRDRVIQTVSKEEVMREAQKAADGLAQRAGTDKFKHRPWRSFATK
ncbi:MAG: amidohydrolase family protein [Coleofasciculaceae cyanobacterium SM2_3_26]|nr:amidohydrolase family protein [Coleofasciculaceae cyanobacterium SM2_3_26]